MPDLITIVPSRNRPESAYELAFSAALTRSGDSEMHFVVDHNDPTKDDYRKIAELGLGKVIVGYHESMVDALNQHANAVVDEAFAIGFMGDDHRPRSDGWDVAYLEALEDLRVGMVYSDDTIQGRALPTQCAMTASVIATLGWMAPPDFTHLYVDDYWLALFTKLRRVRYLEDVVIEHMHPSAGKVPWDEGHLRVNDPKMFERDKIVLDAIVNQGHLDATVARLEALIA